MSRWITYLNASSGIRRTDEELRKIITNLNRELIKIDGKTQQGLIRAINKIHQETEKGAFTVPIDLGNLQHSFFYVSASGKIGKGGGKTHTPSGAGGGFKGKNAGAIAAGHAALLTESTGKAKALAAMYKGPFVIAGYSANYALWVHEMIWGNFKQGKKTRRSAKWFEIAIKTKQAEIIKIIQSNAKIK